MPIKTVWLGLNFEEAALNHTEESYASENYAVELCAREQAHLSIPSGEYRSDTISWIGSGATPFRPPSRRQ
jgi:hypothetical protein